MRTFNLEPRTFRMHSDPWYVANRGGRPSVMGLLMLGG